MEFIGKVKRVQIQVDSLKVGEKPNRKYIPDPLLLVQELKLTFNGVLGLLNDGAEIIDVHNVLHAQSRNSNFANGISFNFTHHYSQMRNEFGSHLADGCAGENILINSDKNYQLGELGEQLVIKSPHGDALVYLRKLMIAAPCVEFSHYVAQTTISGEALKQTLQFLDNGMRGFYATLETSEPAIIQPGDEVFIV